VRKTGHARKPRNRIERAKRGQVSKGVGRKKKLEKKKKRGMEGRGRGERPPLEIPTTQNAEGDGD